jgi:catechol 2,3-dioxygenase-like lactoylglutathione lyase family enzyme
MSMLTALNHVNILSTDMQKTTAFYEALGFEVGPRPAGFPDPGIWLYVDGKAVLHINPVQGALAQEFGGKHVADLRVVGHALRVVDHFGFSVKGTVAGVTGALDRLGVKYDLWDPIPGANRALYFEDPTTGARIEYVLVDEFVLAQNRPTSGVEVAPGVLVPPEVEYAV